MCLVGYALTTTRERVNKLVWVVLLAIGFWGVKGAISFILEVVEEPLESMGRTGG